MCGALSLFLGLDIAGHLYAVQPIRGVFHFRRSQSRDIEGTVLATEQVFAEIG